jgi:hypothetical protein
MPAGGAVKSTKQPCHAIFSQSCNTHSLATHPGAQDTSDNAHIHDPAVSGKLLISEHHMGLASHDGMLTTASTGQSLTLVAAAAASGDEGLVDLEAYTDYGAAASSSNGLLDGNAMLDQQQQQQTEQAVVGGGVAGQQPRTAGGADAPAEQMHAGWMTSDLSVLLADNYRAYMEAVREQAVVRCLKQLLQDRWQVWLFAVGNSMCSALHVKQTLQHLQPGFGKTLLTPLAFLAADLLHVCAGCAVIAAV